MHDGIATCTSPHSVDETITRLRSLLEQKGVKLFALIDHSGEALQAGFQMPPTKLLIFGNPRAGTPVMLASPSAAIDLPLKILVAQAEDGSTLLSWNDAEWLRQRHGLPSELTQVLAAAGALAHAAAG